MVTDAAGTVVKKLDYDSFGQLVSDSAPAFYLPIGFAGGLADVDTGLVRFGFRDYDPAAGRWTAKDPIFFKSGQANLYGYCGSDPEKYRDSSGLWRLPDYISGNLNIGALVGWSGSFSLDRYGNVYYGPLGGNVGKTAPFPISGSLTVGWLNKCGKPTEERLNNFLSGHGINFGAGFWGGGGITWSPDNGTATEIGFVTPQAGVSYHYSWQRERVGFSW